jgi:hypothetical protein
MTFALPSPERMTADVDAVVVRADHVTERVAIVYLLATS